MTGFPAIINGNTYVEADFENYNWRTGIPNITNDIATVAAAAVVAETNATTAATDAANSATNAATSEANAVAAAAVASSAAASADYPFATTAGTSGAYTVDFSPDRVVGDGFALRVNFHAANDAAPTIQVDGNTPYEIVDGLSYDTGFRQLEAGEIYVGMNLVLMFDSTINKFVITGGFPITKLSRDLDACDNEIKKFKTVSKIISRGDVKEDSGLLIDVLESDARIYGIRTRTLSGTMDFSLRANGAAINFTNGSTITEVPCNTTSTLFNVDEGGNAFVDYVAGTIITADILNVAAAQDLIIDLIISENRV